MLHYRTTSFRALVVWATMLVLAGVSGFRARRALAEEQAQTVQVMIDYGDGVQKHFTSLAWSEGLTVQDAMRAAEKHPRGIKTKSRGSGATALLLAIDDIENEKGGGGRGWMYRVNGKLADRSYGVQKLAPGDAVLWKFEKYR